MPLSVPEFVKRWKIASLSERSGSQSHFIDLCDMLGQPHPAAADAIGERYTFDKPLTKVYGGKGFADVWLRDHFAWEYKGKHKDLKAAYKQINDYREDLGNPPLLVVCDLNRFEVHTNFTATSKRVYAFDLAELERNVVTATCPLPPLEVLRALFGDTSLLRPNRTDAFVTQEAAKVFSRLAERLEIEKRALTDAPIHTKEEIAHFLMRLLFCLFADSIDLLPRRVFRTLLQSDDRFLPRKFLRKLRILFDAMSEPDGIFGEHTIKYFNGGLFDSTAVIELDTTDLGILYEATRYDWAHVAPEIFGTLFERSLNAERRSLIGAHYTAAEDILLLIEPVVMRPLEARWAEVQNSIVTVLGIDPTSSFVTPQGNLRSSQDASNPTAHSANGAALSQPGAQPQENGPVDDQGLKARPKDSASADIMQQGTALRIEGDGLQPVRPMAANRRGASAPEGKTSLLRSNPEAERLLSAWLDELTAVRILDPACGSGNFLYLALRRLLDLWLLAQRFAAKHDISMVLPKMVSPSQLYGIETEFYAHELASIVVWIGFLQWKHEHGIIDNREPILQKLNNIEEGDAIMRYDAEGKPYEPQWPQADYIVGNPPFLGGKLLRRELGDRYVDDLFTLYKGEVKAESDLVVYWFEKARRQLEASRVRRVGLLATQAIRGGANRHVLERIQQTGTIFWAWSDRKWLLQGAAVRVSMIAFERTFPNAYPTTPLPTASETDATDKLSANGATSSQPGAQPQVGDPQESHRAEGPTHWLDGQPVPFINPDLTTGSNSTSALRLKENEGICFMGTTKVGAFDIDAETARKMLSAPVNPNGRPNSDVVRPWINALDVTHRPRNLFIIDFGTDMTELDAALYELPFEYIKKHVYPNRVSGNRAVNKGEWWLFAETRPAMRKALSKKQRAFVTPRVSKHRFFTWMNAGVTPDSRLFVFALDTDHSFGILQSRVHEVWSLETSSRHGVAGDITYNGGSCFDTFPFPYPPGTEPTETNSPIVRAIADAARELVRLRDAWLNPPNASEADLKDRTLTKLYNARPAWLANAHRTLDQAVFAAYGWPADLTDQEILARLLALNHERAAVVSTEVSNQSSAPPSAAKEAAEKVDVR